MSLGLLGLLGLSLVQAGAAFADNPLGAATHAAETLTFSGRVSVEWFDDQREHQTYVTVSSRAGELQINGLSDLVATASQRYLLGANGWDLLSPGDPSALGPLPPLTAKYTVHEAPGPDIIGFQTTEVDLGDPARPDERLYLDRATNLLIREEEFDADGELVRAVGFVQLTISPGGASSNAGTAPPKPAKAVDDIGRRIGATSLPAPYLDPAQLAQGYQRVGVLQAYNGIQVVYSDGLHGLSVFEHLGSYDPSSLPATGEPVTVGRARAMRYVWAGGQLVIWRERGATYTGVGDAPAAEVLAALNELPAARGGSPWQRLRHACRRLVQAVSGTW